MDKIGNSTGHKLRLPLGIIDEIIFQRGAVQAVIRCSVYAVTHERNGINGNLGSFVAYIICVGYLLLTDVHHHYTERHSHVCLAVTESDVLHLLGIKLLEIDICYGTYIAVVVKQVDHSVLVGND